MGGRVVHGQADGLRVGSGDLRDAGRKLKSERRFRTSPHLLFSLATSYHYGKKNTYLSVCFFLSLEQWQCQGTF